MAESKIQVGVAGGRSRLAAHAGDYNDIYPEDSYMEEMNDEARVWRIYNDEADRTDAEMIEGWSGNVDTQLVFAGLFSGVVATFLVQSSQSLQPSYSATSAALLTESIAIQRAVATGGNVSSVPASPLSFNTPFNPGSLQILLNGLWFISLVLTLCTALIAGIIKQWLHFYVSDVSGPSRLRACTRQYRYAGLKRWNVAPIIETLPLIMSISLFLFFIGLILFCQQLSFMNGVTCVIAVLTALFFAFYLGTSTLPFYYPQCPYKSSLSSISWFLTKTCLLFKLKTVHYWRTRASQTLGYQSGYHDYYAREASKLKETFGMSALEARSIRNDLIPLELEVVTEMALHSTNPSVPGIALQSLASLHGRDDAKHVVLSRELSRAVEDRFQRCFQSVGASLYNFVVLGDPAVCERLSRAVFHSSNFLFTTNAPRINALSELDRDNPYYAVLRLFVNHRESADSQRASCKDAIDFMLNHASPKVSSNKFKLHKWICEQFELAVENPSGWLPIPSSLNLCLHLINTLTPEEAPSLREVVMIKYLHAELNYEAKGRRPFELHRHELNNCLLRILPKIGSNVISTGSTDSTNQLFQFLDQFLIKIRKDHLGNIHTKESRYILDLSFWDFSKLELDESLTYPYPQSVEYPASTRSVAEALDEFLSRLIEAVLSETRTFARRDPENVLNRLDVILHLARISNCYTSDRRTTVARFAQWLLGICGDTLPGALRESLEDRVERKLWAFAGSLRGNIQIMEVLTDHKHIKESSRILSMLLKAILPSFKTSVDTEWRAYSSEWRRYMNILFRYLIQSHSNWEDVDRWNTLTAIVESAIMVPQAYPSETKWKKMLNAWSTLLQEQRIKIPLDGDAKTRRADELERISKLLQDGGADLQPWQGSLQQRLGPAFYIDLPLYMEDFCFRSAFHAALVSSYLGDNIVGYRPKEDDRVKLLGNYFRRNLLADQNLAPALEACYTYLVMKEIPCLPKTISDSILKSMQKLIEQQEASHSVPNDHLIAQEYYDNWPVCQHLGDLFKLFLHRDPENAALGLRTPKVSEDRWRTLSDFISFALQSWRAYPERGCWSKLISEWEQLLQNRLALVQELQINEEIGSETMERNIEAESKVKELMDSLRHGKYESFLNSSTLMADGELEKGETVHISRVSTKDDRRRRTLLRGRRHGQKKFSILTTSSFEEV